MRNWYSKAGDGLRWIYDQRIDAPPVLDQIQNFPGGAEFGAEWENLRDEAFVVAGMYNRIPRFHEIMPQQTAISANDGLDWRMHVMKAYGADVRQNLVRCPVISALLARHPEVVSATYSYLAPGKHIPEHRGPFRGVLRFHVGLSMPRNAIGELGATLWIDGEPHLLDNGDTLLWDDTYRHEVLNATDKVRIALLLDVWRPNMPTDMAALSSLLIGTVGTIARFRPEVFAG